MALSTSELTRGASRFSVLAFFLLTSSCLTASPPLAMTPSPSRAGADAAPPAQGVACTDTYFPGGHLAEDLDRLARTCGPGMHPLTPLHEAAQNEADAVDRYSFSALE